MYLINHCTNQNKIYVMENEGFLRQTAIDYDMNYADVKHIKDKHPNFNDFYEALEEFIKTRSQTH